MPKNKTTSPARSQGGIITPKRKTTRGSRSLCSPALSTGSGRLTSLIDQFKDKNMESFALSPLNGRSVLNDNTEIEEPRRKSWWKKLDENQDVMEVLKDNRLPVNDAIEEFIDIEVFSQEKKNYTLDLPESSDNESINSLVLPQRKLFTQKENQPQKKYGHLIDNRESLAKLHKTNTANIDNTVSVGTRELFQNVKRSKPIFPAALLNISPNKTAADKTRENLLADPKPQVRNIFGNRPANKRKHMFADFIASESEDEIPEIQPKVFGFQKKLEQRRISSISKGRDASPASSITTDIEMDFKMLLPSSTMVENQLEDNMLADNTPIKRARLSKLSEAKESEAGTLQTNTTSDTKQSNKSVASKNKSKASPEIKDKSLNNSRTTRSMSKNTSKHDENVNTSVKQDAKGNKSRSKISFKSKELDVSPAKSDTDKQNDTLNKPQTQNKSKTRNSTKAAEIEIDSEEIVVNAINNVTRVINKSTNKSLPNTSATNKKYRTVTIKVHDNVDKTGANDVKENEQEDDENNFTLEYEHDEVLEEAEIHNDHNKNHKDDTTKPNTIVLEKDNQETEINKSKSNKSSSTNKSFQQKPTKIVEESVESQTEQYSADDHVDGNQEQETENVQNKHEEIDKDANNSREDMSAGKVIEENEQDNEVEVNVSQDNEVEANESEENKDEVNVSQENEDEMNGSQDKTANESKEVENEVSEGEDEKEANESDEDEVSVSDVNEDEANESQEVEAEVNESQEIEEEANESQEIEAEEDESQEDEEEANESQEIEEEANKSQEAEEEPNESQEAEEEANESQEIDEEAQESREVVDAHASDEGNDEGMDEDEEKTVNESQVNEVSANESQEVENDEEDSNVASEAESEEVEDDQQMDDSDEADKAIASDPEISDDNQADEMEVDTDEEQESDNESEQNEHESHEERQIEEQNEIEPSEEIEESPNVTHDTTGRHRKKDLNKSPEVILHGNNNTNQTDSFIAKGRHNSVRKTKSMIQNLINKPSLAPARDSIGFSDGTRNSSAEGSGWDSHRTTRKTLRQTFGKDFTPRKSLRALVMEKSAKRQTEHTEMHSETVKFPLANSTEMPEDSNHHVEDIVESDHEVSRIRRQTTLEIYLQKIKEQNIEKKLKMEEAVRNSFKTPVSNSLSLFKVPNKPAPRRPKPTQSKPKKLLKSIIPFDELPSEVIRDMKYKPPKRFQPTNASWITKRLYKYLENKLEAKYDYKARVRAEKLVETIYYFAKDLRRHNVAPTDAVEVLKHELARLEIVHTHFEFYEFFNEFMPREVRIKVIPDIVNKIALPRHGVFSDILSGNTVHE